MTEEEAEIEVLNKSRLAARHLGCQVATILICKNALLRTGLKHILVDTRFAVSDGTIDDRFYPCLPDDMPILFIIDASQYPDGAAEIIKRLKTRRPDARAVVLADRFKLETMIAERAAGADGFCLTTTGRDVLIRSLELVMLGETFFPSTMVLSILDKIPQRPESSSQDYIPMAKMEALDPKIRKLSSREADILRCLMEGAQNKVIARKLDVAEATVKVHVKAILRKIGVGNRTQAAMWAANYMPAVNRIAPSA